MASRIIVIDGLDGSGKATQSEIILNKLIDLGYKAKKLSFPNYASDSSALVKMYLGGEFGDNPEDVNAYVSSAFFAVDRIATFLKEWKDDYENMDYLVFDRYTTSNIVHQMSKLSKDEIKEYIDWLYDLEYNKFKFPRPDMVIFLNLSPEVSQKLMSERYHGDESKKDIHENNIEYLEKCRETAKHAVDLLNWDEIDCSNGENIKPIDEITTLIMNKIKERFDI